MRAFTIVLGIVLACALVFIVIINLQVNKTYRGDILAPEAVTPGKTAVVFGAGVYAESGQPSGVLQDRIKTAVALYQAGKVESLLLSGVGLEGGLEVDAIKQLALEAGIPEQALLLDREGVRTYATCRRAYETFGIEDAVLVTQRFHLPRRCSYVIPLACGAWASARTCGITPHSAARPGPFGTAWLPWRPGGRFNSKSSPRICARVFQTSVLRFRGQNQFTWGTAFGGISA